MKRKYNVFLAGSTSLENERTIVRNAITKWNANEDNKNEDNAITVIVKTYENFPTIISDKPSNLPYNVYIRDKADLVIFVLAGRIGDKTKLEFKIAYEGLKSSKNHPLILVLSLKGSTDEGILEIKEKLKGDEKYYVEYETNKELDSIILQELDKYFGTKRIEEKRIRKSKIRSIVIPIIIFASLLTASFGAYWCLCEYPKKKAIKQAQEVVVFCHSNDNPSACIDRVSKVIEALELAGVPESDTIYDELYKLYYNY